MVLGVDVLGGSISLLPWLYVGEVQWRMSAGLLMSVCDGLLSV